MSNEEIVLKRLKETLDVLKRKNVIGRIDFQIRDMVEDCIRVIEKQSKEIEELKTTKKELTERVLRLESDKFWDNVVSKDKIKAKKEELKKECKNCEFEKFLCKQCFTEKGIKILQSLLEKE